jgi:Fe(3+) dicitrate transport protein
MGKNRKQEGRRAAVVRAIALGAVTTGLAGQAAQAQTMPAAEPAEEAVKSHEVIVPGEKPWLRNVETKRAHLKPEVDGTAITVTKKNTVVKLDEQTTLIDDNLRQLFSRMPGLLVSEQQTPSRANLNYRGIGNPQEGEYVLSLQDGIPIVSDWIGVPTLYYLPVPQTLSAIEMVRGGSNLLYGPEPGPSVNYITRRPDSKKPFAFYTEEAIGSHRMVSAYNEISGVGANWDYKVDFSKRRGGGERGNADYNVSAADVYLGYRIDADQKLMLDLRGYMSESGDPGRMSFTQYTIDRNTTPTPFNRIWVDRNTAALSYEGVFGKTMVTSKLWVGTQDIGQRSGAAFIAPKNPPTTTVIDDARFDFSGIDTRVRQSWGTGNALTAGFVYYHSASPWRQYNNSNVLAAREDTSGTPRLVQDRTTDYFAVFAENVFRFGKFHIVPSMRYEHEAVEIHEKVKPGASPLNQNTYRRNVPLLGLGFGHDFGVGHESYVNISQGYRPLRYLDVSSPFSSLATSNNPDPATSLSYEAGVHAWPAKGLYYDVSVFETRFKNRIESIKLNAIDSINVNSGDTRHRGVELDASYDVFAAGGGQQHLTVFGNLSLLDATFTASVTPGRVGMTPAFAPRHLMRAGAIWSSDRQYKLSLSVVNVGEQFWQDSNAASGAGATFIPALIPSYTVLDLAGEYYVSPRVRLLGGVSNLGDRKYYSRAFGTGLEPANRRSMYFGVSFGI